MTSLFDRFLTAAGAGLGTLSGSPVAVRQRPQACNDEALTETERRLAGALMRVNHVGEVCAQALYQAQALTARTESLRLQMEEAAREEKDHLAWTAERLRELSDRPSLLNPLWYAGTFSIGVAAGVAGDRWSLGFMLETERQVEEHLASHLDILPATDVVSRAIVSQMKRDEAEHAEKARRAGAEPLPPLLCWLMRHLAKGMTVAARRI